MSNDTAERVTALLVKQLGCKPEEVQPDTRLVPHNDGLGRIIYSGEADLGCDSLDIVELVMFVEEEFGVEISDDETTPLYHGRVSDLLRIVDSKRTAEAA